MRIAILGTREIPGHYDGFEKCAEYIALGLANKGHEIFMYNFCNNPNQKLEQNNISIVQMNDPKRSLGKIGQFIFEYKCIRDMKRQNCTIALQLGYGTGSLWTWTIPKELLLIMNIGGIEWKRAKYGALMRKLVLFTERLAVNTCNHLISDSISIQDYLSKKFYKESTYIPHGAYIFKTSDENILNKYSVTKYNYDLYIGNLEREDSVEMILDGATFSKVDRIFLVVGNCFNAYGKFLINKYKHHTQIKFLGEIFESTDLNNLRFFSNIYFHGHTLGITSSLLLNAMACNCLISAHDNDFNRNILGNDGFYFETVQEVADQLSSVRKEDGIYKQIIANNSVKITETYNWKYIVDMYEEYFYQIQRRELNIQQVHI